MIETDPSFRRTALGVVVVEILVLLALWLLGRYFSA
jgi:hypothetical protein